jgi:hypothetical protein
MLVEEAFSQWYQQLSPNDQQRLYQVLVASWCGGQASSHSRELGFSGQNKIGATAPVAAKVKCPKCGKVYDRTDLIDVN